MTDILTYGGDSKHVSKQEINIHRADRKTLGRSRLLRADPHTLQRTNRVVDANKSPQTSIAFVGPTNHVSPVAHEAMRQQVGALGESKSCN